MVTKKPHTLPILILSLGIGIILVSTYFVSLEVTLGFFEWLIYTGCIISAGSVFLYIREMSSDELKVSVNEKKLSEEKGKIKQDKLKLQSELSLIENKEKAVWEKLMLYQQFTEFHDGFDWHLNDNPDSSHEKEVANLLDERIKVFFDKITHNQYEVNGEFNGELLRRDIIELVESIARIYHPDSKNPLLETSVEDLLKALNRLSLQLIVFFEQLPIDIKKYSLQKTYDYIQKGAKAYDYYKVAEPFLTYTKYVTPFARIAVGVNPIASFVSTAVMEGGKHLVKKGSEMYALNLLHDIIGIIANQTTNIYCKDYRYRNKHWLYAVELVEIIHSLPINQAILSKTLKQISGLIFMSEYDRIFIYRCIIDGKSADPGKCDISLLNAEEKKEITTKLTAFIEKNIVSETTILDFDKVKLWRSNIEKRLGVVINLSIDKDDSVLLQSCLYSKSAESKIKPALAKFLVGFMEEEEKTHFLYTDIYIPNSDDEKLKLWLVGTNKRLLLLSEKDNTFKPLWFYKQEGKFSLERIKNRIADDCQVSGGNWLDDSKSVSFIISGKTMGSFDNYFYCLKNYKHG